MSASLILGYTWIYLQISGTAIGTRMAPTYAIIFMHMLETKLFAEAFYKPFIWFRFIDDVCSVWNHGEEKLREFLGWLNSAHRTIKFTSYHSRSEINFLDVTVSLDADSKLSTDLYVKPTDTHQYLHAQSDHAGHTKRAIPYNLATRILNICSDPTKEFSLYGNNEF